MGAGSRGIFLVYQASTVLLAYCQLPCGSEAKPHDRSALLKTSKEPITDRARECFSLMIHIDHRWALRTLAAAGGMPWKHSPSMIGMPLLTKPCNVPCSTTIAPVVVCGLPDDVIVGAIFWEISGSASLPSC